MAKAVIRREKTRIEGQLININKIIYTKILSASLIFIIHISAVLRIYKRKYYTLPRYYYYSNRLDWTLSICLLAVAKSIWWLLEMIFLDGQKLEFCVI